MKAILVLALAICWTSLWAAEQESLPTIRILPEDVDQTSIVQSPAQPGFGTNMLTVRWTYTEAGAKKMLAFRKAHADEKVLERVGDYELRATIVASQDPNWTEEDWLKRRTDKFLAVNEEDAKKIVAGLKGKYKR